MKTSNSVLSAVVVSVLGLSATLSAPQALAVDTKYYPGSMCVKVSSAGTTSINLGSIANNSTSGVLVECPVVKDGTSISSGWVRVTERHPGDNAAANLGCTLYSAYSDDINSVKRFWFSGPNYTRGISTDVKVLSFGAVAASQVGDYFYSCYIPPNDGVNGPSEIHTYRVVENGSTE